MPDIYATYESLEWLCYRRAGHSTMRWFFSLHMHLWADFNKGVAYYARR